MSDDADPGDATAEAMDEVREAAGAVLASLKRLVDAAERVVADPHAFDAIVAGGRGIVEAFTEGFADDPTPAATDGEGEDPQTL